MTPTELVHVVEGRGLSPRKTQSGWQARCPAHDDRSPSLSISEGRDGCILLRCHADCTTEAVVGALGLKMADLFPTAPAQHYASPRRMVKTYDYVDESGKPLFQCVRYEPKDFRQRRPDPANPGGWVWNLQGVRRVLYRLPELRAALAARRTVFICEGEKDVDTLVQQGFVATTNAMGAGKWHSADTEALRDAVRVVVITDKDAPGRKHGHDVATALHGVAGSVKLIELPDRGGKAVKDATDWFATGGTGEELQKIVKTAPDFVPAPLRMGADGLLQRFQVAAWPDPPKAWRNVDRWPDTKAKSEAFAVYQYLATLTPGAVGADQTDQIPFLRFAPDAQERFNSWRADLEQKTRGNREHEAFENHLTKYRKLVPAMALILHLAERGTGPVTQRALERAFVWARYLESHARRIYSTALQPEYGAARELARRLECGDLGPAFTVRELYRKHWTGLDSKEDADAATDILVELGWLRLLQSDGPAVGRPTSQTFLVNPKIHEGGGTVSARIDKTLQTGVLALLAPASTPSCPTLEPSAMPTSITATAGDLPSDEPVESPAELLL
ncbi:MAG: DUF3987 domain-containing protein [Verrucomicrobiia bacterium]